MSSGNFSGHSVIMPELTRMIEDPESLDKATSDAFSYADKDGRHMLFSMRGMLHEVYPNGICKCRTPSEYTGTVERLCAAMTADPVDPSVIPVLPGFIAPSPELMSEIWTPDLYRRLCLAGNSISMLVTDEPTVCFAEGILAGSPETGADICLIIDGKVTSSLIDAVFKACKAGVHVTLCSSDNMIDLLRYSEANNSGVPAVYDGRLILPGRTVMTCVSLNAGDINGNDYTGIKNAVEDILQSEVSRRFDISKRGRLYYNQEQSSAVPAKWGILYPKSIGSALNPEIRGIFAGGAESDIISLKLDQPEMIGDKIQVLRYFATACRSLNKYYPLKIVPHYRDIRYIYDADSFTDALRSHTEFCGDIYGGAILELRFQSVSPSPEQFKSALSGFFRLGGTAVSIDLKGDRYD